jgi:putative membrane protein
MKTRFPAFLPLAFLALFHPALTLAQQTQPSPPPTPQYYMPYWHGHGHMWADGGGFWWGGPLMMLGFIAVCIIIVMLFRRSCCGWHHHHHGPCHMRGGSPGPGTFGDPTYSALQILNERFARGEIQKPEYEEKKAAILTSGPR